MIKAQGRGAEALGSFGLKQFVYLHPAARSPCSAAGLGDSTQLGTARQYFFHYISQILYSTPKRAIRSNHRMDVFGVLYDVCDMQWKQ